MIAIGHVHRLWIEESPVDKAAGGESRHKYRVPMILRLKSESVALCATPHIRRTPFAGVARNVSIIVTGLQPGYRLRIRFSYRVIAMVQRLCYGRPQSLQITMKCGIQITRLCLDL